jgi:pimeloyl-ACP methyl ester carboxylesterase
MRGAGWSAAPRDRYLKTDTADDLAPVLDRLSASPVRLVPHDWGGPVSVIMMLRHPEKVSGFFGVNTLGPWYHPLWRSCDILLPFSEAGGTGGGGATAQRQGSLQFAGAAVGDDIRAIADTGLP